jgi:Xaa-Pro aminopeptidase
VASGFDGVAADGISSATLRLRAEAAGKLMAAADVDALVLFSAPRRLGPSTRTLGNVRYFTGWTPMGAPSLLVLAQSGSPIVLTGGMNEHRIFNQRVAEVAEVRRMDVGAVGAAVRDALKSHGVREKRRIGLAGGAEMTWPWHASLSAEAALISVDDALHAMRLARGPEEVELHRRASAISDSMVQCAMDCAVKPGMTPARLMAEVEGEGLRQGADQAGLWLAVGPAPPLTCFERFELPRDINVGDRVQLGTTLSYEGHFAQGLRMGIRGKPSKALLDCVETLQAIQDEALATLVPGRPLHEVVDTLESVIDAHCPYSRREDPFRFQSCHGLGLDYSEPGMALALSPDRDRALDRDGPKVTENMIFEIHPNFTLPGLGHVCVGDVAMATPSGGVRLTTFPQGLVRLD